VAGPVKFLRCGQTELFLRTPTLYPLGTCLSESRAPVACSLESKARGAEFPYNCFSDLHFILFLFNCLFFCAFCSVSNLVCVPLCAPLRAPLRAPLCPEREREGEGEREMRCFADVRKNVFFGEICGFSERCVFHW
jgi:hypothetical protein